MASSHWRVSCGRSNEHYGKHFQLITFLLPSFSLPSPKPSTFSKPSAREGGGARVASRAPRRSRRARARCSKKPNGHVLHGVTSSRYVLWFITRCFWHSFEFSFLDFGFDSMPLCMLGTGFNCAVLLPGMSSDVSGCTVLRANLRYVHRFACNCIGVHCFACSL